MIREPTVVITAVSAFLSQAVKVAVLLGIVQWDVDQAMGITILIDSFLAIVSALLIRDRVTPTSDPRLPVGTAVNHGMSEVVPAPDAQD